MRIRPSTWSLALCLAVSPALALSACAADAELAAELTSAEAPARTNPYPKVELSDKKSGRTVRYEALSEREKDVVDHGIDTFIAVERGGLEPLGCDIDGLSISCWGGGWMCAAWIDEEGAGAQCWECEVADCD